MDIPELSTEEAAEAYRELRSYEDPYLDLIDISRSAGYLEGVRDSQGIEDFERFPEMLRIVAKRKASNPLWRSNKKFRECLEKGS